MDRKKIFITVILLVGVVYTIYYLQVLSPRRQTLAFVPANFPKALIQETFPIIEFGMSLPATFGNEHLTVEYISDLSAQKNLDRFLDYFDDKGWIFYNAEQPDRSFIISGRSEKDSFGVTIVSLPSGGSKVYINYLPDFFEKVPIPNILR